MPRYSYLPMVCISNYQYNLGVKGQDQIKTKSEIRLITNSSFISTTEGVHILLNGCLLGVDYNIGVLSPLCHRCQKTRSNILSINLWLVTRTPPSFFYQWCSNLAQLLLMTRK